MMEHQTAPVPCPEAGRDFTYSLINSEEAVSRCSRYCVFTYTTVQKSGVKKLFMFLKEVCYVHPSQHLFDKK